MTRTLSMRAAGGPHRAVRFLPLALGGALFCTALAGHVRLGKVLVPPERVVLYVFIGHSNMQGYCGDMDTVRHARAWEYDIEAGEFRQARDPLASKRKAPSPVMPFLKTMAQRHPDYYFCAVKITQAGKMMTETFFPGKPQYTQLVSTLEELEGRTTLAGLLAMFGFVEGISDSLSARLGRDAAWLIGHVRELSGAEHLPCLFGRYEEHADTASSYRQYLRYGERIRLAIEDLPTLDSSGFTALTPRYPVPPEHYCDDHHYGAEGYALWSRTAADILAERGWRWWYDPTPDTLPPATPGDLEVVRAGAVTADLAWRPCVDNVFVTSYQVFVRADTAAHPCTCSVDAQDTTIHLTGLSPGTRYETRVRAIDGAGNGSALSTPVTFTTSTDCGAVRDSLWLTAPSPGQVLVVGDSAAVVCEWGPCTGKPEALTALISGEATQGPWERLPAGAWRCTDSSCVAIVRLDTSLGRGTRYLRLRDTLLDAESGEVGPLYLVAPPEPALVLLSPCEGDRYALHDTIEVRWTHNPDSVSALSMYVSPDSAKTWILVSGDKALPPADTFFRWTPAASPVSLAGRAVLFQVRDYDAHVQAVSGFVEIAAPAAGGRTHGAQNRTLAWRIANGLLIMDIPRTGRTGRVTVRNARGRRLADRMIRAGDAHVVIPLRRLSAGVVVVTSEIDGVSVRRHVVLTD